FAFIVTRHHATRENREHRHHATHFETGLRVSGGERWIHAGVSPASSVRWGTAPGRRRPGRAEEEGGPARGAPRAELSYKGKLSRAPRSFALARSLPVPARGAGADGGRDGRRFPAALPRRRRGTLHHRVRQRRGPSA